MKKITVIGISLLFFVGITSQATARKLHCWDLNENYACDIETEDMNNDGKCNARDCETVEPEEPCYAVPKTGQTTSYATGDDGELEMGVQWPEPRFFDNGDGTITDELTGYIWLRDANCINTHYTSFGSFGGGPVTWAEALEFIEGVNIGLYTECSAGYDDWRLPNIRELHSLVDFGHSFPTLPESHPFNNVQLNDYWSSTSYPSNPTANAYTVAMSHGGSNVGTKTGGNYVWIVRGPLN